MFRIHMIINESINREVLHQSDSHSFICNLNVYFFRLSLIHVDIYLRSHVCVSEFQKKPRQQPLSTLLSNKNNLNRINFRVWFSSNDPVVF